MLSLIDSFSSRVAVEIGLLFLLADAAADNGDSYVDTGNNVRLLRLLTLLELGLCRGGVSPTVDGVVGALAVMGATDFDGVLRPNSFVLLLSYDLMGGMSITLDECSVKLEE